MVDHPLKAFFDRYSVRVSSEDGVKEPYKEVFQAKEKLAQQFIDVASAICGFSSIVPVAPPLLVPDDLQVSDAEYLVETAIKRSLFEYLALFLDASNARLQSITKNRIGSFRRSLGMNADIELSKVQVLDLLTDDPRTERGPGETAYFAAVASAWGVVDTNDISLPITPPDYVSVEGLEAFVEQLARTSNVKILSQLAVHASGHLQTSASSRLKWIDTQKVVPEIVTVLEGNLTFPDAIKTQRRKLSNAGRILKHHSKTLDIASFGTILGALQLAVARGRPDLVETLTAALTKKQASVLAGSLDSQTCQKMETLLLELPGLSPGMTMARQTLLLTMSLAQPDLKTSEQGIWTGVDAADLIDLLQTKSIRSWVFGDPRHEAVHETLAAYVEKASIQQLIEILLNVPEFDEDLVFHQLATISNQSSKEGKLLRKIISHFLSDAIEREVSASKAEVEARYNQELDAIMSDKDSLAKELEQSSGRLAELEARLRNTINLESAQSDARSRLAAFDSIRSYVNLGQEVCHLAESGSTEIGSLAESFTASLGAIGVERVGEIGQFLETDHEAFDITGHTDFDHVRVLQPAFRDIGDRSVVYKRGIAIVDQEQG